MGIVYQKNKKTGITYVYRNEAYWDKEKQQSRAKRNLIGKLFVEFVALIYLSYIKKKMQGTALFENWTLQGLLDELDTTERFESPEHGRLIGEVTKKQKDIYTKLGMKSPSL